MDPLVGPFRPQLQHFCHDRNTRMQEAFTATWWWECGKDQRFQLVAGWFSMFNYFFCSWIIFLHRIVFLLGVFILRTSPLLCRSGVVWCIREWLVLISSVELLYINIEGLRCSFFLSLLHSHLRKLE